MEIIIKDEELYITDCGNKIYGCGHWFPKLDHVDIFSGGWLSDPGLINPCYMKPHMVIYLENGHKMTIYEYELRAFQMAFDKLKNNETGTVSINDNDKIIFSQPQNLNG